MVYSRVVPTVTQRKTRGKRASFGRELARKVPDTSSARWVSMGGARPVRGRGLILSTPTTGEEVGGSDPL